MEKSVFRMENRAFRMENSGADIPVCQPSPQGILALPHLHPHAVGPAGMPATPPRGTDKNVRLTKSGFCEIYLASE
jgi:hypothetical protein